MEIWKDIKGYEGLYQVSDMGNIKVLPRTFKNKSGRTSVVKECIKVCPSFDLAEYFKVSYHTVFAIISGRNWNWLTNQRPA